MTVTFHGRTRTGRDRPENQDAFAGFPEIGLFVVIDGVGQTAAASAALAAFEAAGRGPKRGGEALELAARAAHEAIRAMRGAGAELAALWLEDGTAHVLVCGNCRVYRARDLQLEVLSGTTWVSPPRFLGGDSLELAERSVDVRGGDTFVLTTDGYHRLGDADPHDHRDDPGGYFVRTPLEGLVGSLMAHAEEEDDATVLAVRIAREDLSAGLPERVARALEEWPGTRRGLTVRSARLRFPNSPLGVATKFRRLEMALGCPSNVGHAMAHVSAREFVEWLARQHPELGGPHEWTVDPLPVEDSVALAERIRRVREVVEPLVGRYAGLYLGPIEASADWGPRAELRVVVVRDDDPGAADETGAARAIAKELARLAPELSRHVRVVGEYCK